MAESGVNLANQSVVTWHPLADGIAPAWASGWGEDARGPFVELTVKEVTQRLRWIPAGRFQMGSPDAEPGRYDNEGPQHWVEIRRGFWMCDTPTTQELWEAVMGDNPAKFKSQYRPVEQVSWEDCRQFFVKFNELTSNVKLGLPTEAEWEYACRAGTTEATYAGPIEILRENNAPVLDSVAWYGGNCGVEWELEGGYDTSDWPERQYQSVKGGTRVVATRDPNPWGLYDTLGNVWEWCRDGQRSYEDAPTDDPIGSEEASVDRVIRGGSWHFNARLVRAGCRRARPSVKRYYDIGFRARVL